jgi:xanthine dehydrogenase YagT iron-sulfur-binding subunit
MLAAAATAAPLGHAQSNTAPAASSAPPTEPLFAPPQPVGLRINGKTYELSLEPRTTLLDALREVIGLTGTKKGCDRGQCGACTVLVDGRRINSCLALAIMQEGKEITTIEGLAQSEELHPVQQAFLDHDAFQCGYCTPGQICSAAAMLDEARAGTASAVTPDVRQTRIMLSDAEIRERMSGNICRCGAYPNIVAAINAVAGKKT